MKITNKQKKQKSKTFSDVEVGEVFGFTRLEYAVDYKYCIKTTRDTYFNLINNRHMPIYNRDQPAIVYDAELVVK